MAFISNQAVNGAVSKLTQAFREENCCTVERLLQGEKWMAPTYMKLQFRAEFLTSNNPIYNCSTFRLVAHIFNH